MIKNAYKRYYLKGAGAEAEIPALACRPGLIDGLLLGPLAPGYARIALIRLLEGHTGGHLRFHGEAVLYSSDCWIVPPTGASTIPRGNCVCTDQWPYWPSYILAITAT